MKFYPSVNQNYVVKVLFTISEELAKVAYGHSSLRGTFTQKNGTWLRQNVGKQNLHQYEHV